jgi:hypothetical protein
MHSYRTKISDNKYDYCPAASDSGGLSLQCKLSVGAANDPLETEADAVADRVMRMPDVPLVQRNCADEDKQLEQKPSVAVSESSVSDNFVSELGTGQPLDRAILDYFEPRFGADFSSVRLYADNRAAESADSINALAYTFGKKVVFGSEQYQPQTIQGKQLLAHELTHVVQQSNTSPTLQPKLKFTGTADHVSRAITLLNSGLGSFYNVSADKSGDVKIEPIRAAHTSSITGPNAQQKAMADRLWTVINDPKDVSMTVSSGSKTLGGSWDTGDFDIADLETYGAGGLIHEIVEQHQKQAKGVKNFGTATTGAHGEASKAESEVTGLKRGADKVISMTQNADGTIDAVIETPHTFPDGKVKTMVSTIKNSNIVSITWK